MSASSTVKTKTPGQIMEIVRNDVNQLTEDDKDIVILALEPIEELFRQKRTANWIAEEGGGAYFTPGGNPVYKCDTCGYVYGANEIHPTGKICRGCGRLMKNGRRWH